ncbi:MAG: thiamine phosphate synthase, partial [Methylocella sp.]
RIKDKPDVTIRAEITEAKALCERHGAKLVVNDYWRQAIDAGCDFIHLGQGDLATADLAVIRRAGIKFGVSTHDEAELSRALDVSPHYIALGPVYPTVLKTMAFPPQGLSRIAEWKKRIGKIPLVAIGGITLERVAGVLQAGADSAAVVTDISRNTDPKQRTRDWVKATREEASCIEPNALSPR